MKRLVIILVSLMASFAVFGQTTEKPQFTGGEQALQKFIDANLRYPSDALYAGLEGRVILKLMIDKKGEITEIKVVNSLCESCDEEAIRLVMSMPKWQPGKKNGKETDSSYKLSVYFKIKIKEETKVNDEEQMWRRRLGLD